MLSAESAASVSEEVSLVRPPPWVHATRTTVAPVGIDTAVVLELEWTVGKIEFSELNNRIEQHIPCKSSEIADIKTTQDHLLTRSLTRTFAPRSWTFSHSGTCHSWDSCCTLATRAAAHSARICCMTRDNGSRLCESNICHTCPQDIQATTLPGSLAMH